MCRRKLVCACGLTALGAGLLLGQLTKTWFVMTLVGLGLVGLGLWMLGSR